MKLSLEPESDDLLEVYLDGANLEELGAFKGIRILVICYKQPTLQEQARVFHFTLSSEGWIATAEAREGYAPLNYTLRLEDDGDDGQKQCIDIEGFDPECDWVLFGGTDENWYPADPRRRKCCLRCDEPQPVEGIS